MKTTKKQLKFSKGEINTPLLERTDLSLLNSSASYINNYISTIYGGFKTREGTQEIDSILDSLVPKFGAFTTSIGGDINDIGVAGFVSTTITGATTEIELDVTDIEVYEKIILTNIKLSFEDGAVSATDTAGVIDVVNIDTAGKGYKAITVDVVGDGTGAVLTPTLATDGSIASIAITNGGSGYTSYSVVITETDTWTDEQELEISSNGSTWTKVADITVTRTAQMVEPSITSSYRYVRLSRDGSAITTCLEFFNLVVYNEIAAENRVRMLPFIFNEDQKYLLMLTDETIRVYQDDQLLETIAAAGLKDDYFKRLKYTQAEDTMVVTHPSMYPKQIRRNVEEGLSILPVFGAGETTKDGFTISADSTNVYRMCDGDLATNTNRGEYYYDIGTSGSGVPTTYDAELSNDLIVDFDGARTIKTATLNVSDIENYKIYTKNIGGTYDLRDAGTFIIPSPYTTENRTITTTLDVECYGLKYETTGVKVIIINNESLPESLRTYAAEWYPIKAFEISSFETVTSLFQVSDFPLENIPYHNFGTPTETSQTIGITPSQAEGSAEITADSAVFTEDSVGQYINTDLGSRFKITSYISTTKVSGYTVVPFLNTNKVTAWTYETGYEESWSETRGYPNTCLFYQQRLWFGGSMGRPQTLWGSRTDKYNDFQNIGAYDNDSIEAPIASRETNEIVNLYDNRGLQIFTNADEYVANEESLTPSNIFITKVTPNGSLSRAEPISVGGTTLFIEKNGKSLLSFVYAEGEANYVTGNISLLNSHMISSPLRLAIDYNSNRETGNYLFMAKTDGELLVSCIHLDQQINAFSRFNTNGLVKDVVVLKSDTYLLVEREDTIYLEKITDVRTDATVLKAPTQVVTGLDKFDDLEVRVYTTTQDYGLFTVESGEIDLGEVPTETLYIGEDFTCTLISNPVYISNETTSKYKRVSRATLTTHNTTDISLNGRAKTSTTDIFDYYSVNGFRRKNQITLSSTFDRVEVLSVMLYINYGGA